MDKQKKIDELSSLLRRLSASYYAGESLVPDVAFDRLQETLRDLAPNHPVLKEIGASIDSHLKKAEHTIPMYSLNKVNTKDAFIKWVNKVDTKWFVVTEKFDGLSIELLYIEGKFNQAITRGTGKVGEDVTRSIRHIQWLEPTLTGFSGSLRAEVIISKADFENFFKGNDYSNPRYSNPRNAAAGFVRRKKLDERLKYLQLKYFNCVSAMEKFITKDRQLDYMKTLGLKMPPYKVVNVNDAIRLYEFYQENRRDKLDYEIDGLVIEANDLAVQDRLGVVDGKPKASMAWKFPSMTAETVLRDVIAMVGKTGRITPVGHFDKIHVGGVDVEKASLHTYSNVDNLGLFIGGKIIVSRRNDVIPYIEKASSDPTSMSVYYPVAPKECPSCSTKLIREGEYILCPNEACPGRRLGDFLKWIERAEIEEAGPAFLQDVMSTKLFDFIVEDISDLYKLTPEHLMLMEGYKKTKASKIIRNINKKKKLPLETILAGLNIPNIGRRVCKKIVEAGFDNLDDLYEVSIEELEKLEGIGSVKAKLFHEGIRSKRKILAKLLRNGVEIMKKKEGKLNGQSFCFTGALSIKRTEAKRMVEDLGGEFKSSVSKGLTYLVQPDSTSQTTKARKAREIGTEVIGEDDFMKLVDFEI